MSRLAQIYGLEASPDTAATVRSSMQKFWFDQSQRSIAMALRMRVLAKEARTSLACYPQQAADARTGAGGFARAHHYLKQARRERQFAANP